MAISNQFTQFPWQDWQRIFPQEKKPKLSTTSLTGNWVITGEFRGKTSTRTGEPNVHVAFSTQKGYSYVFWPKWLGEESKYILELAYAITVHKSRAAVLI